MPIVDLDDLDLGAPTPELPPGVGMSASGSQWVTRTDREGDSRSTRYENVHGSQYTIAEWHAMGRPQPAPRGYVTNGPDLKFDPATYDETEKLRDNPDFDPDVVRKYVTPGELDLDYGSDNPVESRSWSSSFIDAAFRNEKVLGAAFRQGNTIGAYLSSEGAPDGVEPGFDAWERIKGTRYEPYWNSFVDVRSTVAFYAKQRQIDQEVEDRKTLAAAPWYVSLPAQLMAGTLDWPSLFPGGAFVRGAKGGFSIARSALSVGAAGGMSTAAQEMALHGIQELRTPEESAVNIGASVILTPLIGTAGCRALG